MVAGQFDSFWPGETPIWLAIAPTIHNYDIWDREVRAVVPVETTWLEIKQHYMGWVHFGQRTFNCSAGAHKNRACYGEALIREHWDGVNKIQEETGVKPEGKAPINATSNFVLAVVIAENVYKIPAVDKNGKLKKSKAGAQIYNYKAEPLLSEEDIEKYPCQFGHSMHWSLQTEQITYIRDFWGAKLEHYCTTPGCAMPMEVVTLCCPECETRKQLRRPVSGADLDIELNKPRTCEDCKFKGNFITAYDSYICNNCNNPTTGGGLLGFEIRVQKVKVGDKYKLDIVDVRTPVQYQPDVDPVLAERMAKLVASPLDVAAIFAPTPLARQKALIGEERASRVSPEPRGSNATSTEGYGVPEETEQNINWKEE